MAEGIKETTEALDAFFAFTEEGARLASDGLQVTDAVQFATNTSLFAKAKLAYDGKEKIPAEMKDLDEAEAAAIAQKVFEGNIRTLKAYGFPEDSPVLKYFNAGPRVLALAHHNYVEGKAIYELVK